MGSLQNTKIAYQTTQAVVPLALAYAANVALDLSARNNFIIGILTGNLTLSFTNPISGASGFIVLTQDATGGRTLTISGGNTRTPGGVAIALSTNANAKDKLYWDCDDGSTVNLVIQKDFR